ncbi:metallophosphoesterase family protein [Propionibacteriaceae bacterium G1746]
MSIPPVNRRSFIGLTVGAGVVGAASAAGAAPAFAQPVRPLSDEAWTFGLMADTQWAQNADGINPGSVAAGIQAMVFDQLLAKDVKFVVQVGDNVDQEHNGYNGQSEVRTLPIKAQTVQPLYDAGVGFYTLRGNHEASARAASEFPAVFPQNTGNAPVLGGATNFSSPSALLRGLSYSFDVKNLRVLMLDQFTRPDGSGSTNNNMLDQLDWIEDRVLNRPEGMHCLVYAHKNLVGQNHVDSMFGGTPAANKAALNRFISIMDRGNVHTVASGHDHMHHRSLVVSPDGQSTVEQLIAGNDSAKFYTPRVPAIADTYGVNETVLSQELWTLTHYVVTVDGPRLYIDLYSMSTGVDYQTTWLGRTPPDTGWFWREQWGYSLNGRNFVVAPGEGYQVVQDSFGKTRARILEGVNGSTKADYAGRRMSKQIGTGWQAAGPGDDSDRLYLWGIADNLQLNDPALTGLWPHADETDESDTFVLQLTGTPQGFRADGSYGLATRTRDGRWVNAVDENHGGTKRFVRGAHRPGHALGTHGVDPVTGNVWAVVNHGGVFAVRRGI